MHLKTRNVNTAFVDLIKGINSNSEWKYHIPTKRTTSRNGDVLQIEEPVIITYERPRERVLLSPERDCNCFFHLFEAIWMLAGSNKLAPVAFFTPGMKNYSDDGTTMNGAYGYRWRKAPYTPPVYISGSPTRIDQLEQLIEHLSEFPDSRRAVLQMWAVKQDLMRVDGGNMRIYSKDVACNLSVCFSIRDFIGDCEKSKDGGHFWNAVYPNPSKCLNCGKTLVAPKLDMTVFNRSNDLILGCLGANVVHFSFLQEYMACALGVEVGVYNQVSNNLHVYCNNWEPEKWLKGSEHANCYPNLYDGPLFENREQFDRECQNLVAVLDHPDAATEYRYIAGYLAGIQLKERFLIQVVRPMCIAFCYHKLREYTDANYWLGLVAAPDWQRVGTEWVQRRQAKWQQKQGQV